ncbi:Hypothetical protein, putative [Bodo saltans]|uniref:Uncharacterized protein n=1 Tax=Bodo saltans TaxID=75058 RepID=A0A0S4JDH1_BODSA|nr:Hypothetical protein, putative [Bodo saltans]|eukprot:CUG88139.1 Hypothetical protein, putative [Bodo saltans]
MFKASRCVLQASLFRGSYINSSDFALSFPRMQINTHLLDAGLPELKDCKAAFHEDATLNSGKCFSLLQRGREVFTNIPGWQESEAMSNVVRSIAASRIQLVSDYYTPHTTGALLSSSTTGRPAVLMPKIARSQFIFNEASLALSTNVWSFTDVQQLDISCYLVAKLLESISHLHPRREAASVEADHLLPKSLKPLIEQTMKQIDQLIVLSEKAVVQHAEHHNSLRWLPIKLKLCKALTTIALDGNLNIAKDIITRAALQVEEWNKKKSLLSDSKHDLNLGMLMLMRAEISARIFNWTTSPKELIDNDVVQLFRQACDYYSGRFDDPLHHDAVMDLTQASRGAYTQEHTLSEDAVARDAYATCLLGYGNFLLSAPRTNPKEIIFPRGEMFTRNAFLTMPSGSDLIFDDCRSPVPLTIASTRKQSQESLDRALKINRALFPEHRNNAKAGWTLLSMACGFGDLRDYLYSTGLLGNAANVFREQYGEISEEMLHFERIQERLLNGIGSAKEAETRRHRIDVIKSELATYQQQ